MPLASELVDAAAKAGADAIKFQTHFPEHEMLRGGATAAYVGESLFDLLTRTALSREAHATLRDLAAKKGIIFLSTPFSREAADFLETLGVPAFKTGSGELTNIPLQRHIARKGKPMIVSTGMSTPEEIDATVQALDEERARYALMHCTSTYPTPFEHVQLGCIASLQSKYGVPVGFSDHTLGTAISLAAVASGANIFEKHFTASRSLPGPDQQGSMEPKELEALVRGHPRDRAVARRDEEDSAGRAGRAQHGAPQRRVDSGYRRRRDDRRGRYLGEASRHRAFLRGSCSDIVGRVAKRAIARDQLISWDDLQ